MWLAAARLTEPDYRAGLGLGLRLGIGDNNAAADSNQLQEDPETETEVRPRPAVQVKVTNEVESAIQMRTMLMRMRNRGYERRRWQANYFDTQMALLSGLMSPGPLPISGKHSLASSSSSTIEQQLHRLQPDYKLLYNADHHTYFHLHTLTRDAPQKSEPEAPHRRLFQQVVGSTLTAAFGLNVMDKGQMAVTSEQVNLYDAASLRRSRFNPFNPTR